ncbi:aspartate 1-decarboxylase [Hydrogenibacillus schlegelii]|uniref:Aspartate 1-decarboxylase n=1 Tax=Hydrogenibacillus schlegelii TaxID=1484 RepID=A0A132NB91_HYDSH|nr:MULTISPECIES: aspartate 1-decarboxylase [Hydrogenibacillus]KWX07266.1 hypothetical protein TR75_03540 [Hydrogenibacillus schlegelii]MBT9283627.1 aspartate 1-decarboxylase [Hydrogenibacillus schlegelii]OAR05070.1 hypothetical protein SA87_06070 [Hydrogenibacillus schlegelii]PTQ54465.1 MAG: Aspartate 1-decarboxylase [Hydrogenibacillus schlegelii]QZA32112.1 aspartate 1-decarboxylase [Hydrogenibacillus sp. N12]
MWLTMMKGKIHRATVTEANLHYVGSITIDADLLQAAGILPNERVQVVNVTTGARLETYVIPGPAGSGVVGLNGAAARLVQVGDVVIIIAYALMTPEEAARHRPSVVFVDAANRPTAVALGEAAEMREGPAL